MRVWKQWRERGIRRKKGKVGVVRRVDDDNEKDGRTETDREVEAKKRYESGGWMKTRIASRVHVKGGEKK